MHICQKLAPAGKNSTDISAGSAAFPISASKMDVFFRWGGVFSRKVGNFPDMWAETYVSALLVSYSFFCKIYPLVVLVVVLVVIHRF